MIILVSVKKAPLTLNQVAHEIPQVISGLLLAFTNEHHMIKVLSDGIQKLVTSIDLGKKNNNKLNIFLQIFNFVKQKGSENLFLEYKLK